MGGQIPMEIHYHSLTGIDWHLIGIDPGCLVKCYLNNELMNDFVR